MTTRRPIALLHRLGWHAVVALGSSLMGCGAPNEAAHDDGGQTGSAACGASPRCICDSVAGAALARGVITLTNATEASVEVVEVFGDTNVAVGDNLVGPYQVGFPCGLGNLPPLADGSEVLVVNPPPQGTLTNLYVVAWAPTLQLTPEFTLAASDAALLTDRAACEVQFPDKEILCKDNF